MGNTTGVPAHRVALTNGWSAWRTFMLRSAGFPARSVLGLASPAAAAAADRAGALAAELAATRAEALAALWRRFEAGGPLGPSARAIAERLERGKQPRPDPAVEAEVDALRRFHALTTAVAEARAQLATAYAGALEAARAEVCAWAEHPRFREALLWQNRHAVHTTLDQLRAHPEARNSKARQKHAMDARYLQRYALKNDTIGFFGPIGWGAFGGERAVEVAPGPALLRARRVELEHWAVDALARALGARAELRPFAAPRLLPANAVRDTTLSYGLGKTSKLPLPVARLLAACDGDTPAVDIAAALCAQPELELAAPQEVYDLLEQLAERKLITWTFEPATLRPLDELARLVARVEPASLRAEAEAAIARVADARAALDRAAGDPVAVDAALGAMSAAFVALTGQAEKRSEGEMYAGRTLVFEDCVRDVHLQLGAPVLARLAPSFELIGLAARWFSHTLAARYRAALDAAYAQAAPAPGAPVRLLRVLAALGDLGPLVTAVAEELDARWGTVLGLGDLAAAGREVTLAPDEVLARARAEFAAPGPGWPGARYVSPDILIAAASAAHVARGEARLVIGEAHINNTLLLRLNLPHAPPDLIAGYEADLPAPRVMAMAGTYHWNRAAQIPWTPRDLDLELDATRSWRPRAEVLRSGALVVEPGDGALVVRDTESDRVFDVIAALEALLKQGISGAFGIRVRAPHVPRVTVGDVVLARETWRLARADLPATTGADDEVFAALRAWQRRLGLPRWVFVKSPEERKPVFVDFDSPLYVDALAKLIGQASALTIGEMLPAIDECWLPDAAGDTYAAEMRIALLDPAPWRPTPAAP